MALADVWKGKETLMSGPRPQTSSAIVHFELMTFRRVYRVCGQLLNAELYHEAFGPCKTYDPASG